MWLSRCCALRIHSGQPESFFTLLIVFSNTLLGNEVATCRAKAVLGGVLDLLLSSVARLRSQFSSSPNHISETLPLSCFLVNVSRCPIIRFPKFTPTN
jgi:hypothetical protein